MVALNWLLFEKYCCGHTFPFEMFSYWLNGDHTLQHRVPECTDQFIVLIESMTERYRWVTNVDVQARFLELQVNRISFLFC